MEGLPLKYLLKRGVKKAISDPVRNICAILLSAACAVLFVYAELFFAYDPVAVTAKFIKRDLNESDYKYARLYTEGSSGPANFDVADYVAERYKALKYVNIPEGDASISYTSDYSGDGHNFYIINSYEDILSFGYTFYGDYEKTLSEGSAYVSDTSLKDCTYYAYEDGKWKLQDYLGSADTSSEWFSSFVGKSIYLVGYEGFKINIAGVVNTGAYSLSFRDAELEGEDDLGNNLNAERENSLRSEQLTAIGLGIFCEESFVRTLAVNGGSLLIGARVWGCEDGHDVTFSLQSESYSFDSSDNITVSNTARYYEGHNRLYAVSYKNDEGEYNYFLRAPTEENDGFTVSEEMIVSDRDICDENEIMLSAELYKKLFDENYNYGYSSLPSHIGEKISVNITVDGEIYEINDKTFVGVYEGGCVYYTDASTFGIICPCDEVNRLIADYSSSNYSAIVNISALSEDELASLIRGLDDYDANALLIGYNAAVLEAESIGDAKNIYMIISAVLFVMSLLFGAWNVLHTVKRDYREIGILRANGVTARDMSVIYAVQFILGGIISFVLSLIGVNILIAVYTPSDKNVIRVMQCFSELTLYWVGAEEVLLLLALSLVVPLLISVFAFFRVRKISPVEAINEAKRNE